MIAFLGSGSPRRIAPHLYAGIVAAARAPVFYKDLAVADTIEGRYEMIVLHVVLLLRRLRMPDCKNPRLAQAVVDYMANDFDRSMRELGVGDLSVARFMKRLGEGLYGRAAVYDAALDGDDKDGLDRALVRNIYDGVHPSPAILDVLNRYVQDHNRHLAAQPMDRIGAGKVDFLPPEGSFGA